MNIEYIGEHLLPGIIGNIFVVLTFVGALFSGTSYFLAQQKKDDSWRSLGRLFFRIHSVSVIGIAIILFYIIFNHYFEYNYVFQHSSTDLPLRYMLSCFWEGQEGSYLLWLFWHVVLGNLIIHTSGKWESSVLTVFSSVQLILGSMLLGVYIFGFKIGGNPFLLLRESTEMMNVPIFQNPNYTGLIEGNGLNPLLQNYWMTIHPPTLFLGFASTLVPFSFAIASLWRKAYTEWLKPVLPWTFFGILILGTGVLMGGAWAYEALSFGGFWAWDPVENASLVPWMLFVAAGHMMLINYKKKDKASSLVSTYVVTMLTFLLVLYSTYLTRSGILGDTSVHSFADGMPGQLILFLSIYVILSAVFILIRYKDIPNKKEDEPFLSREFWMFIASLVLVIASFQITFTTSIPVINAIFNTSMAPPIDAIAHFNSWQIPFAIVIALFMALAQFLNYKKTNSAKFLKGIIPGIIGSLILTVVIAIGLKINHSILIALLFASLLTVLSNTDYLIRIIKGKIKNAGPSIAHIGFGLILLGSLLSAGLQKTISVNTSGIDIRMQGDESNANMENILLYKNDTLPMGPYMVTYEGQHKEGINMYYEVKYLTYDENKIASEFSLFPKLQLNKKMGDVSEPDTKHFLNRDLFTYVSYVNRQNVDEEEKPDYVVTDTLVLQEGDTAVVSPYMIIYRGISNKVDRDKLKLIEGDVAVKAIVEINDLHNKKAMMEPVMLIRDKQIFSVPDQSLDFGIRINLANVDPTNGKLTFIAEKDKNKKEDFVIMKAVIFPYINVLWIGCIVMILGSGIAIYNRVKSKN